MLSAAGRDRACGARYRGGALMTWETVIGLEVPRTAQHAHQNVLRVPHQLRRSAEHQRVSRLSRTSRRAAVPNARGRPAFGAPRRDGARLRGAPAKRLCTQELLLSRPSQGIPDLAVRPAARHRRDALTFDSPDRGKIDVGITRLHLEEDAGKLIHDRYPGQNGGGPQPGRNTAGRNRERARSCARRRRRGAYLTRLAGRSWCTPGVSEVQHGAGKPSGRREHLRSAEPVIPSSAPRRK